jgi:DNA-binding FadR family transcriptional regulator
MTCATLLPVPLRDAPQIGTAGSAGGEQGGDAQRRIRKTSEFVAMQIVKDIVDGGLVEGDRLPLEAAMVRRYRVSRASLREALRLLEVQGLISLRPGRGGGPAVGAADPQHLARTATLFFHLDGTSYEELFLAHLELECEVSALAAANPDRARVEQLLAPLAAQVDPGDDALTRTHVREFHLRVAEACGNGVVELVASTLAYIVRTHVLASMEPVHMQAAVIAEHRQLAAAILAGNARRARDLTRRHFQVQLDWYRQQWASHLARPIEWR